MSTPDQSLQIPLSSGVVAGSMGDENIRVFKGIPYAAAPIGPRRWRPPEPVAPWTGIRPASAFGPDCPQNGARTSNATSMDEDCLYLNVWAPRSAAGARALPVMVWIHGGGFTAGSGADPRCDGMALARLGVMVVSFNYRVGLFGYLTHPGLSQESPQGISGNYGLMDQIAALRWVQNNIAAFGGDPQRVTVFGVSAGSASISLLLAVRQAHALFGQCILHSPGAGRPLASLAQAEQAGRALGEDITVLRGLSTQELLERTSLLVPKVRGLTTARVLRPIRDQVLITEDERPAFQAGRLQAMPMLVGSNADEGSLLTASWPISTREDYLHILHSNFALMPERAMAAYPVTADDQARVRVAEMFADCQFNYGVRLLARSMARTGQPVWRYLFTRRRPQQLDGPHHGDEVGHVFGNLAAARPGRPALFDARDQEVSAAMMRAWAGFATSGQAHWERYDPTHDNHLEFGDVLRAGQFWRAAQCDFLDDFFDLQDAQASAVGTPP
jgi:para-nitrobenzyl esterase